MWAIHKSTIMALVYAACVCGLHAEEATADGGGLRTLKYTSGDKSQAIRWQKELRARLAQPLKMEDLLSRNAVNPLNPKTLS